MSEIALSIHPDLTEESKVEIVERKGIGHPDTICDALAENLSRNLCQWYLENVGAIHHHNVDKALLSAGASRAVFGDGEVLSPIEIYLAGRATTKIGDKLVPLEELAIEGSRKWLGTHLPALDPDRHVRIHCLVRPGSSELKGLFLRKGKYGDVLANDTSIGVGYAPFSEVETACLKTGAWLDDNESDHRHPAWGKDTKLMAVRRDTEVDVTVACAMIASACASKSEYNAACSTLQKQVANEFRLNGFRQPQVQVNAADNPDESQYYLTATGTSAEAGDDGQVGRGNRVTGLITPNRQMSLEAACGKNPVNHVGKVYNLAAGKIAATIIETCEPIQSVRCCLVSRIGNPISQPTIVDIAVKTTDGRPLEFCRQAVSEIANETLTHLPRIMRDVINGELRLY